MTTGVGCTLYLDGVRVNDGTPGENELDPTALSPLSVTWGRSTTMDQPDAATCSVTIQDLAGGVAFIDQFAIGKQIDVQAHALVYPAPSTSTFLDPGFETSTAVAASYANASAAIATRRHRGGAKSAELKPTDAARTYTVTFPPAPYSGTVSAWDAIAATTAGQSWGYGASVFLPPGAVAELRPVLFSSPSASSAVVVDKPIKITAAGWSTVSGIFVPSQSQRRVGVVLKVYPTGQRWLDLPPALAWQDAGTLNPDTSMTPWAWIDHAAAFVDDIAVLSPAAGTDRTVLVFEGRITDLVASFDDSLGSVSVELTATDFTADTENRKVGDEPWPVETALARMQRILTAAGTGLVGTIDSTIASTKVSYQDVDSTGAMSLLQDLAQSLDGVLWAEAHLAAGGYVHIEDPGTRAALNVLVQQPDGTVVIAQGTIPNALEISACDVLRAPVQWEQAVADVSTRARVTWLEQLPPDPNSGQISTTEHSVQIIDADLESSFGTRAVSVSTILQSATDANAVAARVLGRTHLTDWRASGLTIDDDLSLDSPDADAASMMLDLLDGAGRNGKGLNLTDLPPWAPNAPTVGVFLEGGDYTFEAGTWTLALTVGSSKSQGKSVAWNELGAAWQWKQFDPNISWIDLIGTSGPGSALERIS